MYVSCCYIYKCILLIVKWSTSSAHCACSDQAWPYMEAVATHLLKENGTQGQAFLTIIKAVTKTEVVSTICLVPIWSLPYTRQLLLGGFLKQHLCLLWYSAVWSWMFSLPNRDSMHNKGNENNRPYQGVHFAMLQKVCTAIQFKHDINVYYTTVASSAIMLWP